MMVSYCVRRFLHLGSLTLRETSIAPAQIQKATKTEDKDHQNNFVDWIRVRIKAGEGGNGKVSTSSVYANEFAGPDGGDGGNGAHILFRASKKLNSLSHLKTVINAPNGGSGGHSDLEGKCATHKIIDVPVGTLFRNLEREVVAELSQENTMFLAARGGAGGKGNAFFKTAERQTPFVAETGGSGESFTFDIGIYFARFIDFYA